MGEDKKLRVYIDTSVIGGCFDIEFQVFSKQIIDEFIQGKKIILISSVLIEELELAPQKIKEVLMKIPTQYSEQLVMTNEIKELANIYQDKNIIPQKSNADALHIAYASYYKADMLVSWNFKHIVNLGKIHQFNGVNLKDGYTILEIRTPMEVIENNA